MPLLRRSKFYLFLFLILGILTVYAGCGGTNLIEDVRTVFTEWFGPKTPRQAYRRAMEKEGSFTADELHRWSTSYDVARTTVLATPLPHREIFGLDSTLAHSAQALRVRVPGGRKLTVTVEQDRPRIFGELYRLDERGRPRKRPARTLDGEQSFTFTADDPRGEDILLLFQTALFDSVRYDVQLTTEPLRLFPVAGKDERAIQSFWGAARDGGRRKHEGNDIFADRGTDLLAVCNGTISRVKNGGLGGKTVWLRDRELGVSYYYAHLDEQLVSAGQIVARGDVVGTVGNTGNARTTPPHLHFGIYANGALDPYPYLQDADGPQPKPRYTLPGFAERVAVPDRGNHYLRSAPKRKGTVLRQLENGERVTVLGVTGRFYRVVTENGERGFVNFD